MGSRNIYLFTAADGQVVNFSDQINFWTGSWPDGILSAPVELREYETPLRDGSTFSSMKFTPKEVDIPVLIAYPNWTQYLSGIRWLLTVLNPMKGLGTLKVITEDGKERFVDCIYKSGLEGKPLRLANNGGGVYVITFRAFYPFWQDAIATSGTFTKDPPNTFFPFFPLKLSQSGIYKDLTVTNDGDAPAWPIWRIYGYGEDPLIRNLTTGKLIQAGIHIEAGDYMEIDTRPGHKTVQLSDGTNVFGILTDASSLFTLERGINSIRLELNYSDANSKLFYSFNTPRLTI